MSLTAAQSQTAIRGFEHYKKFFDNSLKANVVKISPGDYYQGRTKTQEKLVYLNTKREDHRDFPEENCATRVSESVGSTLLRPKP